MNQNFDLESEELSLLNFQQDIFNISQYEEDFNIFKFDTFLESIKDKKEEIENENIFSNDKKKIEDKNIKNIKNIKYSNDPQFNDNRALFVIKNSKKDIISNNSHNSNQKIEIENVIEMKLNIFICKKEKKEKLYRKDAYYKHFKAIFVKYLRNKVEHLKNRCFPNFILNKFSTPNYSFTGNPKEIDNYNFLSWTIKEILVYKENKKKVNRQYNNKLLIEYIEKNEKKSMDKKAYEELIYYLNSRLEKAYTDFYEDENEFNKICKDEDCIFYDKFFKKETGVSLLEKNGFLKVILNDKEI